MLVYNYLCRRYSALAVKYQSKLNIMLVCLYLRGKREKYIALAVKNIEASFVFFCSFISIFVVTDENMLHSL